MNVLKVTVTERIGSSKDFRQILAAAGDIVLSVEGSVEQEFLLRTELTQDELLDRIWEDRYSMVWCRVEDITPASTDEAGDAPVSD